MASEAKDPVIVDDPMPDTLLFVRGIEGFVLRTTEYTNPSRLWAFSTISEATQFLADVYGSDLPDDDI